MAITVGKRGCGDRVAGGIYLACPPGPVGHPIECHLFDPAKPVEAAVLGLSPRGVTLFDDGAGTTHVMDWIGSEHYPNVADFVEETRRLGVSRRIAKTAELARLGPRSKLFTVHSRALITNPGDWYAVDDVEWQPCPAHLAYAHCRRGLAAPHVIGDLDLPACARLWWHDVEGGAVGDDGLYFRQSGSTVYVAQERPPDVTPAYGLAIFGAFPIVQIEVIADHEGTGTESAMQAASQARLPLVLMDE
jgi:hypothetical protein